MAPDFLQGQPTSREYINLFTGIISKGKVNVAYKLANFKYLGCKPSRIISCVSLALPLASCLSLQSDL